MGIPLDYDQLQAVCQMNVDDFFTAEFAASLGGKVINGKNGRHLYADRGSDILLVAHTDTVNDSKLFQRIDIDYDNGTRDMWILTRAADDRLGVAIITKWLIMPDFGIDYDILLTEGEEKGHSTAKDFKPDKQYNWIAEFDRRGSDAVYYDNDTEIRQLLKGVGFEVGTGSWSDVGELQDLGCKAFNVGVGYYDEHTEWAAICPRITVKQVNLFLAFYRKHRADFLARKGPGRGKWGGGYSDTGSSKDKVVAVPTTERDYSHLGYRWCQGCGHFVLKKHFDKKKYLCNWCRDNKTPKKYLCNSCKSSQVEGQFNEQGICMLCAEYVQKPTMRCVACDKPVEPGLLYAGGLCIDCAIRA